MNEINKDLTLFVVGNEYTDRPRYQYFKYMMKDKHGIIHGFCNKADGSDFVAIDALRLDHYEYTKKKILESWFRSIKRKRQHLGSSVH